MEQPPSWIDASFFDRPVVEVSRDLIGRRLTVANADEKIEGLLVEVEAYGGPDDPASHAAFKPNGRARVMWNAPGTIYVYAAYGVYPCFNIVCGPEGQPSAALIRGVLFGNDHKPVLGPGKVARELGVTLEDQSECWSGERFNISADRLDLSIHATPRVGINRATERLWRFHADVDEIRERYAHGDQTP